MRPAGVVVSIEGGAPHPGLPEHFLEAAACREHLEGLRWPGGFRCATCGSSDSWRTATGQLLCSGCRGATSVTAGTIFHGSRVGLPQWFAAAWLVTEGPGGMSALGLQRALGVGSYETAWAMLHRLRRVMATDLVERLMGSVEVGLVEVGVVERKSDPLRNGEATVAIAVEARSSGPGRLRLGKLDGPSELQLVDFVTRSVDHGATLRTDGSPVFRRLTAGFGHEVDARAGSDSLAQAVTMLSSWAAGHLHRGVSDAHLAYYLDELSFRWNVPSDDANGARFQRLLFLAVRHDPAPFRELVGGTSLPGMPRPVGS